MNQLFTQISDFMLQYPLRQRMILIGVLIAFISAIISLLLWANRTEYELLYANLEPAAASSIVTDLRDSKVKYRLNNGGTTIYVSRDNVAELRLKYVQSGYLKDAVSGYELFEENTMGMTTFMQQLNLRRALEGELMRTINQFAEVRQCRVHLNVPERRLFEEDEVGSASVVLHIQPGMKMSNAQVSGIGALVANSVEGIEVDNVVVMDSKGNILVEKPQESGVINTVGNQWEMQQSVANVIQKKVMALVEGIVGKQNAVVKVSAELNFDQLERTIEHIDPDNAVLLSEERYIETSASGLDSSNVNVEKIKSNFELSKRVEHFIANTGDIKRLTVAVLVNGKYNEAVGDAEQTKQYTARSTQELEQIASLVRTAVGYSGERGDVVEVQNMQFVEEVVNNDQEYFEDMIQQEKLETIITYVLLGLGLLLSFFLLRGLLKTSVVGLSLAKNQELPGGESSGQTGKLEGKKTAAIKAMEEEEELNEDLYIAKLSPEARAKLKAKDKMTDEVIQFAKDSPENATKLMRSWLTEER